MQAILSYPALADCRRLFLRDYEIYINIGVHDFEKKAEQRVILNVDLYIPLNMNTPSKDLLEEVVDYDFMRETIKSLSSQGHIHLQETFCDDIVAAMLLHPKVVPFLFDCLWLVGFRYLRHIFSTTDTHG